MNKAIYEKLKGIAKAQDTIAYGEIAPLAELDMSRRNDRKAISAILGEISTLEHEQGHPLLSAVVVLAETNMPGQGFFTLAKDLGLHVGTNDLTFFSHELDKVHRFWAEE